jgi:hypothetical protein
LKLTLLLVKITQENGQEHYRYGGWWSVWWTGTYSMVLTKAAFIHKTYLEMYTNEMPTTLLEFVKRERYGSLRRSYKVLAFMQCFRGCGVCKFYSVCWGTVSGN